MPRLDEEQRRRLRLAIRYLIAHDALQRGHQTRLAAYFHLSRQAVHQLVSVERRRLSA